VHAGIRFTSASSLDFLVRFLKNRDLNMLMYEEGCNAKVVLCFRMFEGGGKKSMKRGTVFVCFCRARIERRKCFIKLVGLIADHHIFRLVFYC
jgi:hypothetical protein